jgi:hypothetical protein
MAATTGTKLTIPFTVGTSQIVGQGLKPELWALLSYDDVSDPTPAWTDVTADVREFGWTRGRESELSEMDAGTASVTLDNRGNDYDPSTHSYIRPMNRLWLREQFSGLTNDCFKGYVESYDQQWPKPGISDALVIANAVDEFKVLNLYNLSTTNPSRDTYEDLIAFDSPACYWRMHDSSDDASVAIFEQAITGKDLYAIDGAREDNSPGAIVGSNDAYTILPATKRMVTSTTVAGDPEDIGGTGSGTMEMWFRAAVVDAGPDTILYSCPNTAGPNLSFRLRLLTTGVIQLQARNSGGTTTSISSSPLKNNTWYHVVGTYDSVNLTLYINGAQAAQTTASGFFAAATTVLQLGDSASGGSMDFDEVALYHYALPVARVLAHYVAGAQRGFPSQLPGARLEAALDSVSSNTPRNLQAGVRTMIPSFMHGQALLEELRMATQADSDDAILFMAKDGTITFLQTDYRASSPYNTVQATFDDDGTDLPYQDLAVDFSDAFIANDWNVTAADSTTQSASDTTSIAKYFKRTQSLTGVPVMSDADALDIAQDMLTKYKDPMQRVTSIALTTDDVNVCHAVFQRELCDRIRVIRTLPGGGLFDQTLYIQKIDVSGANDQGPWTITLGVSPL